MSKTQKSTVLVFLSSLFFATGGLFFKICAWEAMAISSARSILAGMMILIILLVKGHKFKVNLHVILAAVSISCTNMLYALANKLTTAGNTIVLQFSMPVFVIMIMAVLYKKKPSLLEGITCIAVVGGIVCFFIDSLSAGNMLGNALALISGFSYAGFFIFNSRDDSEPFTAILLSYAVTAIIGLPWLVQTDFVSSGLTDYGSVLALGLFQQGLAQICFALGIVNVSPVAASLISGVEPVFNPVLVALIYGETLSPLSIAGAIIVLGAIMAYNVIVAKQKSI